MRIGIGLVRMWLNYGDEKTMFDLEGCFWGE